MKTCKYLKKRKTQKKYKNRRYKSVSRCRSYNRKPMKTIKKKSRKNKRYKLFGYKLFGGADGTPIKDINLQLLAGEKIPTYMMGYGEFNQPQPCGSVSVLNTNTRCTAGSGPAQVGGG